MDLAHLCYAGGLNVLSAQQRDVFVSDKAFFAALLCVTQEKATQYGAKTAFDEAMVSCEETPKERSFLGVQNRERRCGI